jgi:HK97 gp10 family phage protein
MSTVTVRMDDAALHELFHSPRGPVGMDLARRAVKVDREAKHLCPVDTGRLRSSITNQLATDERGLLALIGTNVDYAIYQELGTRFMPAQPFLRPALRAAA